MDTTFKIKTMRWYFFLLIPSWAPHFLHKLWIYRHGLTFWYEVMQISIHLIEVIQEVAWALSVDKLSLSALPTDVVVKPRGDSTLIRRVCATGVLNLSPCSGVGKPKKDTLLWSYHSFLLYCIVLETKIMFTLHLFNQMSLFPFSSIMFVQKSVKFSITVISLSYDICIAFQD